MKTGQFYENPNFIDALEEIYLHKQQISNNHKAYIQLLNAADVWSFIALFT